MIDINLVNDYLVLHLQADFWSTLDEDKKTAAFKMAQNDVCAYLGITEIDPLRVFQLCAVSEQAVFLAGNYSGLSSANQIKSEKIDGVGAREYHPCVISNFSPRALTFLEREAEVLTISRG